MVECGQTGAARVRYLSRSLASLGLQNEAAHIPGASYLRPS